MLMSWLCVEQVICRSFKFSALFVGSFPRESRSAASCFFLFRFSATSSHQLDFENHRTCIRSAGAFVISLTSLENNSSCSASVGFLNCSPASLSLKSFLFILAKLVWCSPYTGFSRCRWHEVTSPSWRTSDPGL